MRPLPLRLAGWSGVLFVVLSCVIAVVAPRWPPLGASPDAIAAYYGAHGDAFLWGNWLAAVPGAPAFLVLAVLVAQLRRAEGEGGWLWLAVLGAGLAVHADGLVVLGLFQTVPFVSDAAGAGLAVSHLANAGFGFFLIALGALQLFTGWAGQATTALPRWLSLGSLAGAPVSFLASAGSVKPVGHFAAGSLATIVAFLLFIAWNVGLAVWWLRSPSPSPSAA